MAGAYQRVPEENGPTLAENAVELQSIATASTGAEGEQASGDTAGETGGENGEFVVNLVSSDAVNKRVPAAPSSTVGAVVLEAFPESKDKRVRVIFLGRVLQNDVSLHDQGVQSNAFLHVQISEPKTEEELAREAAQAQEQEQDGDFDELQLRAFIAAQRPRQRRQGTNAQFLIGLCVGGVFGILALLWLVQRGVTVKQRLGIAFGIFLNLAFTLIQYLLKDKSDLNGGATGGHGNRIGPSPGEGSTSFTGGAFGMFGIGGQ